MGFPGLVRWHKENFAADRPFIVGETGGYSVSKATQTASGGYGGLNEYNQSLRDLESLRDAIEGHADGSVLVSWIDTWHYPRDPDKHDNEPWEWDGVFAIETDRPKDMAGVPRQVYRDLMNFNTLIPWEPKANHIYPIGKPQPIQLFTPSVVTSADYSLNDGDWLPLEPSGFGSFHGFFTLPPLARKYQTLNFRAMDEEGTVLAKKDVTFLTGVAPETLLLDQPPAERGAKGLRFRAKVLNGPGKPIDQRKIYFGCFYPLSFGQAHAVISTDAQGQAIFVCPEEPAPEDRFIYVAAGTDSPERVRTCDMKIFKLGK